MYYLGQSVRITESNMYGIYGGKDSTGGHWIARTFDIGKDDAIESDIDFFSYEDDAIETILATNNGDKPLPVHKKLYRGPLCTNRLSGELGPKFIENNYKKIITELKYLNDDE